MSSIRYIKYCCSIVLLIMAGCSTTFSNALIHPNRQPVIKTPADYGLEYESIEFKTPDNINISGWLVHNNKNKLAIMVPPMNFTKYGYSIEHQGLFKITDIEVEFIKTLKNLYKEGYTVLTFDLRNHGESEDHPGNLFALGNYEFNDVIGALNFINSREDLDSMDKSFISFCTGANATFLAMKNRPALFADVDSIVAVQPISMEVFVTNFMDDKYKPFKWLIPSIEEDIKKSTDYSFYDLSPERYVDGIIVPTLFVQAKEDRWTDYRFVEKLYNLTPYDKKKLLILKGDMHRFDTYNYFGHTPEPMLDFLNNNRREIQGD